MLERYLEINRRIVDGLDGEVIMWHYPWARHSQNCKRNETLALADALIRNMPSPPRVSVGGLKAQYMYSGDIIHLPTFENFESPEEFLSTKFHELIHSTGSIDRLGRIAITKRCNKKQIFLWSEENIIAELGSIYLCSMIGADNGTFRNSIGYLQGCLWDLGENRKVMRMACAHAIQAVEYILGL